MKQKITQLNEWLAVQITRWFSTMMCFYLCVLYSLAAALPHLAHYQPQMLYWSNAVQLSALPVLGLGQIVLSRAAEKRAMEDHDAIAQDHQIIMEQLEELRQVHEELRKMVTKVV